MFVKSVLPKKSKRYWNVSILLHNFFEFSEMKNFDLNSVIHLIAKIFNKPKFKVPKIFRFRMNGIL
jgi:hypothetical protein